jgi:TPR repeat protein
MNEKDNFALVPRPPGALEKAEPGAKRILSGMVADTLALTKRALSRKSRPLRIVMVNDEDCVLRSFEVIIRLWFKDVTMLFFENGATALEELLRADPDLLITDDRMAVMSGGELCQRLLDRQVTYPIIVDSAWEPTEQWVRELADRGLNVSFLPVPCDAESIVKSVETALKVTRVTIKQSAETTLEQLREAAEQGDADAQYKLGRCYDDGTGVLKNLIEAFKWYYKAAEQGLSAAQFMIGHCLMTGEGVPKDSVEAFKWYRKSAEQGFSPAQVNLATCYRHGQGVPQNMVEAAKWYHKAAEQGVAEAQSSLGYFYRMGEGVQQDMAEAVKWCRKAAEQGHATAQYNLAVHYTCGAGVPQDYAAGARGYRAAAEKGFPEAQACLGFCYHTGFGVPKNENSGDSEAVIWYRRAVEAGNVLAIHNLAVCYSWGRGVNHDQAEAARLFQMLAEQGNSMAQYNLGIAYLYGKGVAKDLVQAHKCFKLAAEQGYEAASKEMVSTETLLSPERFQEAELVAARTHQRFIPMLSPQQFPKVGFGFVFTEAVPES